jgi:hypothetical protein
VVNHHVITDRRVAMPEEHATPLTPSREAGGIGERGVAADPGIGPPLSKDVPPWQTYTALATLSTTVLSLTAASTVHFRPMPPPLAIPARLAMLSRKAFFVTSGL